MVTVIVPFRDRDDHLREFIPFMDAFLNGVDIVIVEQDRGKPFNRGKLLNIGTLEAPRASCYCFHDVDMLPVVADYSPVSTPTHLAARVEQFAYKLPYPGYFGGVTLFDKPSFIKVNGYSNTYGGWGAEDDDMLFRCVACGLRPTRKHGTYRSLPHATSGGATTDNFKKYLDFKKSDDVFERMRSDGLTTVEYEVLSRESRRRVTHVLVRI